jgi:4-amino-4-deoxy-L-arabinose transferase-like glycosyltransferase
VLWSTYPFNLWLTGQSDVTNILVSLLLLSAMLFMSWAEFGRHSTSRGFLLGAVLAFSALMKPSFLGLPIIFLALGYICRTGRTHRDRRIFSASLLFGYCLLLAPWEGWAHHASGQWIPLCLNGPNVLIDGLTFGTVRHVPPVRMPSNVYALTQRAVSHYSQLKTTPEILHFVGQQARDHPGALAELYLVKAARSWYGNESHTYESIIAVIQLCYTPFVAHGLLLLRRGPEKQRWLFFLVVGVVFYFWTMTVLTSLPLLRYLVPALSLMMIPAAASLERIVSGEQVESTVKEPAGVSKLGQTLVTH